MAKRQGKHTLEPMMVELRIPISKVTKDGVTKFTEEESVRLAIRILHHQSPTGSTRSILPGPGRELFG